MHMIDITASNVRITSLLANRTRQFYLFHSSHPCVKMTHAGNPSLARSHLLTNFEIVSSLGFGTFGLVFRATSRLDKRAYAVKVVQPEEGMHEFREVETLAHLPSHANVVQYFGSWRDSLNKQELQEVTAVLGDVGKHSAFRVALGQPTLQLVCIQMELCHEDLRTWLGRHTTVNTDGRLCIFQQICCGLKHIHDHRFIHRDMKPENIFFVMIGAKKKMAKIGDFGLATGHQTGQTLRLLALHTRAVGTREYWAPEQAISNNYGAAVDLYALGLILYELFEPSIQSVPRSGENHAQGQDTLLTAFDQLKRNRVLTKQLHRWPTIAQLILSLVEMNPSERPRIHDVCIAVATMRTAPNHRPPAPSPRPLSLEANRLKLPSTPSTFVSEPLSIQSKSPFMPQPSSVQPIEFPRITTPAPLELPPEIVQINSSADSPPPPLFVEPVVKAKGKLKRAETFTKADIGVPTNLVHVEHMGFDTQHGITRHVLNKEYKERFDKAGFTPAELPDPNVRRIFVNQFMDQYDRYQSTRVSGRRVQFVPDTYQNPIQSALPYGNRKKRPAPPLPPPPPPPPRPPPLETKPSRMSTPPPVAIDADSGCYAMSSEEGLVAGCEDEEAAPRP